MVRGAVCILGPEATRPWCVVRLMLSGAILSLAPVACGQRRCRRPHCTTYRTGDPAPFTFLTMPMNKPLTNAQLELMKLFSHDLSEEDLLALKRTMANFFADRASDAMDKVWEEKGWSVATMEEWLGDPETEE